MSHRAPRPRRLRNIAVASLSAFTVLLAVLYIFAPSGQPRVSVQIQDLGTANGHVQLAAYTTDVAAQAPAAGCDGPDAEVIYGKVTVARGVPSPSVKIAVLTTHDALCHRITVSGAGVYRWVPHLNAGMPYHVWVSVRVNGRTVTDTRRLTFRAGHAYRVSVKILTPQLFAFLPITTY